MGMYVCGPCIEEHALKTSRLTAGTGVLQCEVCGHTKGDWEEKFCAFVPDLERFGAPVAEQLKALRETWGTM